MEPDFKLFLAGLAALYQFLDVTSTNKAIRFGAGHEDNKAMAALMAVLGAFWWLVKPAMLAVSYWLVWDNPLGFYVLTIAACIFYHWVVFGNNLPTIARWRKRRTRK